MTYCFFESRIGAAAKRFLAYARNDTLSYREGGENDGGSAAIIFTRFPLRGSHFERSEKSHVICAEAAIYMSD
jgi:hypothetical protein